MAGVAGDGSDAKVLRERSPQSPGQDVKLSFAGKSVHFFDPETGNRID